MKKSTGKFFALMLTVTVLVSCAVSTGIFTASAYTAPKEGKIFYNKTMYDKYGKVEGLWFLTALKILTRKSISAVLMFREAMLRNFFKVLTLTHPGVYYVNQGFSYSTIRQRIRLRQSIPSTQSARVSMQHRKSRLIKRLREFFRLWTRI